MDFDLRIRTVLLTVYGSRAYGTHNPDSDVDLRGVCVPPGKYFHGFRHSFEQADQPADLVVFRDLLTPVELQATEREGKNDGVVYDVRKFFTLAVNNNPNVIEALFCRDEEVRLCTPAGRKLRDHRKDFLSRKVLSTFRGYAYNQLSRIQNHRAWLLHPLDHQPKREEFGLKPMPLIGGDQYRSVESQIQKQLSSWEIDMTGLDDAQRIYLQEQITHSLTELSITREVQWEAAARCIGLDDNFIRMVAQERKYQSASKDWAAYQKWQKERNPERAKMEAEFGLDLKHASHLVRLLGACREILTTGDYQVYRPDAEFLRSIRAGAWSYDQILDWASLQDTELKQLARTSILPNEPNYEFLDQLCQETVESML